MCAGGKSPEAREVQGEAKNLVFTLKPSPPQLLGISRSRDFTYSRLFLPLGILYLLYFLSLLFNKKKKRQLCLVHTLRDPQGQSVPSGSPEPGKSMRTWKWGDAVSHHLLSLVFPLCLKSKKPSQHSTWPCLPTLLPGPVPRALSLCHAPLLGKPRDEAQTPRVPCEASQVAHCDAPPGSVSSLPPKGP